MKPLTLKQIADWSGGRLIRGNPAEAVTRVSTDSRGDGAGALFVPLVGERFDAHAFLPQAFAHGAVAAFSSRPLLESASFPALIAVDDTLLALHKLAKAYRSSLSPFVSVGVTGSNGKTSTKDFLTAVLARKFSVHATKGNLNNHVGLPLTVLSAGAEHTAGVFEMGMNHFGEIAPLCDIAQPGLGVITNIGTAHIEFLGSREGIAKEKGVLAEAIGADGCVVLNADDDMTPALALRTKARVITAGLGGGEVRGENLRGSSFDLVIPGEPVVSVALPVPGRHMVGNALLAAAAGWRLGLSSGEIKAGLEAAHVYGGRLQRREAAGLRFLDDSYNANPDSMIAALRTLHELPVEGRRIAVLGRMGELGPHAVSGHREVGQAARAEGVDFLLAVGQDDARLIHEAFGDPARSLSVGNCEEAAAWLRGHAGPGDLILLKGSRAAAMERVLGALELPAAS